MDTETRRRSALYHVQLILHNPTDGMDRMAAIAGGISTRTLTERLSPFGNNGTGCRNGIG